MVPLRRLSRTGVSRQRSSVCFNYDFARRLVPCMHPLKCGIALVAGGVRMSPPA